MKPNRELLLDYLLGALDDNEQAEVEQLLQHDQRLQQELDDLQEMLEPLAESYQEYDPPADLAEQTCSLVAQHANAERVMLAGSGLSAPPESATSRGRLSMADVVVAAGIFLAAGLLFFPAISNSRELARIASCQDNLRQLGLALHDYCDKVGVGYFPCVPTEGKQAFSGIYGPILQETGYLPNPRWVICPSSPLAQHGPEFRIPTLEQIQSAEGAALLAIRQGAGGSYGYNLGFVVDGRHCWPQNRGRANFALMADAPNVAGPELRSRNHGGRGQNLLFEDGHIEFVADRLAAGLLDHPFQNHFGRVEAGVNRDDAVVGPSFAGPFPYSRP